MEVKQMGLKEETKSPAGGGSHCQTGDIVSLETGYWHDNISLIWGRLSTPASAFKTH